MTRWRFINILRLAVFLNVRISSFSVLKSNTGNKEPCIVFVLSISIVRFSEKSICEYIERCDDKINNSDRMIFFTIVFLFL